LAKDIAELKAVSQKLMHTNISTTDGIYGILSETDIKAKIANLGENNMLADNPSLKKLINLTKKMIEKLN